MGRPIKRDKQEVIDMVMEMAKTGKITWKRLEEAKIRNYVALHFGGVIQLQKTLGLDKSTWGGFNRPRTASGPYKRKKYRYAKPTVDIKKELKDRYCLKCGDTFKSWGIANRICPQCNINNDRFYDVSAEGAVDY